VLSTGELTYDLVTGKLPATRSDHVVAEPPRFNPKKADARDLLHDLSRAEAGARLEE
jgi:hypothetical protein